MSSTDRKRERRRGSRACSRPNPVPGEDPGVGKDRSRLVESERCFLTAQRSWLRRTRTTTGRNARSREAVPQGHRLPRPAAPRRRDQAATPPSPAQPRHDPGGHNRSHCGAITPGPSSPKFHDRRGNLDLLQSSPPWKAVGTTDSKRHRRLESSTSMEVVTMRARVGFVPCSRQEVDPQRRSWCVPAPLGVLTHCRAAPAGSRSEPSAGG